MQATFQTRLHLQNPAESILSAWGAMQGRIERTLFAAYCRAGGDAKAVDQCKPKICAREGITSRQFNAIWAMLKGKIASRLEVDRVAANELRAESKALRQSIASLAKQKSPHSERQRRSYNAKKRRLQRAEQRLVRLESGRPALCFGSRKLFRAQFALEGNGYASHDEWLAAWRDARSNSFFLLGSKDETGGNQSCTATLAENGTLCLRLRLPDALLARNVGQKYLMLQNVWFEHGQLELYEALGSGRAISYRFLRDSKGWRVFASTERPDTRAAADFHLGALGVDINADHLAVAETDRFGNLVGYHRMPCVTQGKTAKQRQQVVREAGKAVVRLAAAAGKPLVHEKLDFSRRKQELGTFGDRRYARMLSSLAYSGIVQAIQSSALLDGVPTAAVNPAYTSVVGRVKYAKPLGISVHQAPALVIARRGMGYGEAAPRRSAVPDGKGDHLEFELPARNRSKHEWSHWASVRSKLQGTLAGWHRLRKLAALEAAARAAASSG